MPLSCCVTNSGGTPTNSGNCQGSGSSTSPPIAVPGNSTTTNGALNTVVNVLIVELCTSLSRKYLFANFCIYRDVMRRYLIIFLIGPIWLVLLALSSAAARYFWQNLNCNLEFLLFHMLGDFSSILRNLIPVNMKN